MSLRGELLMAAIVIAMLGAWAWFWTGPELRWERQLYERPPAVSDGAPVSSTGHALDGWGK